ncbi:hypothetical protein KGF54_004827 [Candida jiufengensis]|uniref:uncharacterized protein n=1 Tax=Candida jiufengensis TaxID=497108 RepID=UPI002225B16A|nr:uncharacterized protein KGF54_004827 [Candida jiufengensis]KAI5951752.1 hypothetical protein KGF54_004827 [Candida jiufengensis]
MVSALYVLHIPINNNNNNNDFNILDSTNFQCLISRRFHEDHIPEDSIILNSFYKQIINLSSDQLVPVLENEKLSYIFIRCENDIVILAVTNKNINVMSVIMFLKNFHLILLHYLCKTRQKILHHQKQKNLTKEVIQDNSILISELIDECLDFGILQITDYKLLEEYIKVEPNLPKYDQENGNISDDSNESDEEEDPDEKKKTKNKNKKNKATEDIKSTHNQAVKTDVLKNQTGVVNSSILRTYSSAINWRPKGIFYAKNEIFIDIIEDCEFIFDLQTSTIKRNEIYGTCVVKSYLSGIPICRVGFNENYMSTIENEDVIEATRVEEEQDELPENQIIDNDNLLDEDDLDDAISQSSSQNSLLTNKPRHKIPIRNIQFHQCIELSKIYRENIVTFIPPDDKFILMTYHVEQHKNKKKLPLLLVKPVFKIDKINGRLQILCTLNTNFPRRRHCRSLIIRIPINPFYFNINLSDTNLKYKTENGEVSFKFDSMEIIWKIETIDGKKTVRMMCELSLLDINEICIEKISNYILRKVSKKNLSQRDINDEEDMNEIENNDTLNELNDFYGVNGNKTSTSNKQMLKKIKQTFKSDDIVLTFKIPMFTYSGLKLSYLSIKEEQLEYSCFPWIRYLTKSSDKIGEIEDEFINSSNCMYRFKLGVDCFTFD